ncbi:ficolin-1-like, partial [Saccostrea cucullata]|uniref:ficolin-1-like n=1 Tax=Saccostrea cuccullata TaxID=36930 RepID=UPI002ED5DD02
INNTWREVFCDMTTDEGGWTVIQKREDEEEFYRTWNAYKHGFGNASKSYWLGNDAIYELTKKKDQELRVELEQFNGAEAHALYSSFSVGNESTKYTLTLSGYSGTAGNGLGYHNLMKFTTKDQDNDKKSTSNCAVEFHGA